MVIHYIVEKIFLPLLITSFQYRKILKRHIKDCFEINGKQRIKIPRKVNMLDLKISKEK